MTNKKKAITGLDSYQVMYWVKDQDTAFTERKVETLQLAGKSAHAKAAQKVVDRWRSQGKSVQIVSVVFQ